ncbi:MAG: sulfite oxidase [Actinomycetota bacterium]|nr:sulfite oxidase [Actinomycetota bacterium]
MAAPEGISLDELQLAARNHGMPLEALRYDLTPAGLHYLLIHYDIPDVDAGSWRLKLGGEVERPLSLSLADLRARPAAEVVATMECAGNGRARLSPRAISQPWLLEAVGTARWGGVPLGVLLEEAGLRQGAIEVVFTGLDRGTEGGVVQNYERSLSVDEARGEEVLLAYEMNGEPLLPQHGFPLRLVVPGWYGMTNVKWLARITAVAQPFDGYQHERAYLFREHEDDAGVQVTRMQPRSLMVPPGIPDFHTRVRHVPVGPCRLEGRAWSGWAPVSRVEVSADGGESWAEAKLEHGPGSWAWRRWDFDWDAAEPGSYSLCSRATDEAGNEQPVAGVWNVGGYSNNGVQQVPVVVYEDNPNSPDA